MKRMKFGRMLVLTTAIAFLALSSGATQRPGRRGPGRGEPRYDPATEVSVKGTVQEVRKQVRSGAWTGIHLTLKTDKETLDVHLGPSSFLLKNQMTFAKGDQIEVTGSKVTLQGADALIAREVKKGDKTLTLRDPRGIPLWSGGRRGSA
jgi:DNA/RNA endonuclease YhcR with UshA esterase domain